VSPRRRLATLALLLVALAPAGSLAAQSSFSRGQKPFASISRMFLASDSRDSLVDLARDQIGTRYRWGASAPGTAFDCSGLVQWLMANFAVELPRTSREQSRIGLEIPRDPDELLPGDLLFFGTGRVVNHVGIYVGDGRYVHASNSRRGVVESNLPSRNSSFWKGARRLFTHQDEVPPTIAEVLTTPVVVRATGV
jgi:cell wall-associated NlpC family hydrolase